MIAEAGSPVAPAETGEVAETPPLRQPVRREEGLMVLGLVLDLAVAELGRGGAPAVGGRRIPARVTRALLYLGHEGARSITLGDLAGGLGVSLGWASRIVDELVAEGLLERERDGADRRVVQLRLTEGAGELSRRLWLERKRAITAALHEVAPGERQAVIRFLERAATAFAAEPARSAVRAGRRSSG